MFLPISCRIQSYFYWAGRCCRPLENLQAVGPEYDLDYDQNRAMLSTLNVGPTLDPRFQTYRYLRTPEEPVKRDSPRRVFLMVMWGLWVRSSAQAWRYRVVVSCDCGLW